MANRNFPQSKQWSNHLMPVSLDASVSIGAAGAPTIESALGIASITRMAAGQYRMQLQDNFAELLQFGVTMQSAVTGAAVAGGAFVVATVYQIVTLGNTTQAQWEAAGVPAGITAAPGVTFKAATIGAGTGTVKAMGGSGIASAELMSNADQMLNKQPYNSNMGGYVDFQTMDSSNAAADPADGSKMQIRILVNNSKVQ